MRSDDMCMLPSSSHATLGTIQDTGKLLWTQDSEVPGDCGVANSWEAKAAIRRPVPAGYCDGPWVVAASCLFMPTR